MWKWTWLLVCMACVNEEDKPPPDEESDSEPAPDTDEAETDEHETDAADTDMPDTDTVDTDIVDTDIVDTDIVDTDAPDTDLVDTDTPDTDLPDTDMVDTSVDLCAQASVHAGVPGQPFTPLMGGETLLVEAGPQGGFHIWFAAELYVIDGPTTITTTIDLATGVRVSSSSLRRNLIPQAGCLTVVDSLQAVLDYLAVGMTLRDLDGQAAHVEITATQGARSLSDGADFIIDVP